MSDMDVTAVAAFEMGSALQGAVEALEGGIAEAARHDEADLAAALTHVADEVDGAGVKAEAARVADGAASLPGTLQAGEDVAEWASFRLQFLLAETRNPHLVPYLATAYALLLQSVALARRYRETDLGEGAA